MEGIGIRYSVFGALGNRRTECKKVRRSEGDGILRTVRIEGEKINHRRHIRAGVRRISSQKQVGIRPTFNN
jgi:hypothetical protein